MIALYLLAAHLVGDFLLQTRWQAARKLEERSFRLSHVSAYAVPFVPLAAWRTWGGPWASWHAQRGVAFVVALVVLHYLTDSRRFRSTLGDWVGWRLLAAGPREGEWFMYLAGQRDADDPRDPSLTIRVPPETLGTPPPNPWAPMPLLVDQTLHICQLALLAGIFLS